MRSESRDMKRRKGRSCKCNTPQKRTVLLLKIQDSWLRPRPQGKRRLKATRWRHKPWHWRWVASALHRTGKKYLALPELYSKLAFSRFSDSLSWLVFFAYCYMLCYFMFLMLCSTPIDLFLWALWTWNRFDMIDTCVHSYDWYMCTFIYLSYSSILNSALYHVCLNCTDYGFAIFVYTIHMCKHPKKGMLQAYCWCLQTPRQFRKYLFYDKVRWPGIRSIISMRRFDAGWLAGVLQCVGFQFSIDGFDSLANHGFAFPFMHTFFEWYVQLYTVHSIHTIPFNKIHLWNLGSIKLLEKLLVWLCKLGNANEFWESWPQRTEIIAK